MSKVVLDFYCCQGGAGTGWHRATGLRIVGIDLHPQPLYPFEFIQADAIETIRHLAAGGAIGLEPRCQRMVRKEDIVVVHASPPCQLDSVASKSHNGRPQDHPDLIGPTREALEELGLPYVIENVEGARRKLRDPIMLCGTMFPGLRVKRHRFFECVGFAIEAPGVCPSKHPLHYTRDKRKPHYGKLDEMTAFVSVNGGGNSSKEAAADAMGIEWPMTKQGLNEAIPPAYTEYIGRRFVESSMRAAA